MMTQYSLYRYGALPIHVAAGVVCLSLLLVAWLFGFMPLMANAQQSTSVIAQAEQAEFDAKLAKGELDRLTKDVESVVAKLAAQPVHLRSAV